ncbi:MAG: ABC-F family ATP-binding cassette domain-containing protein [Lachnospiraceae bacterium]|jgi:ATP-binding cassette subfamily F protein 3|nr:ABC-F family ATP-binding cassette domain-containing protein [Lachnospiraceae bacterium]
MIVSCSHIHKSFVTGAVLSDVSFHINEREKAAIVGINGAGKSTLLKIITGELPADSGEVTFSKGTTVGYLAQHQELATERTIYEVMLEIKKEVLALDKRMRELEAEMKHSEGAALERLLADYSRCSHEFEQQNGYAYKSEITGVLKGLGFEEEEFQKPVSQLSGGQKTRVYLGRLLLSTPDILFLDEPTNHLDMNSIAWLETFLLNYKGTVVIVAHDRYFLDKIVSKVIEIEQTRAETYEGNYTQYAAKKAAKREIALRHYLNQQQEIKHQEEVIAKLRSFNREKSIKRAESREKMLAKIERLEKPVLSEAQMHFVLEPQHISGQDVLAVSGLAKSFGSHSLFSDLQFEIKRGERVALIGNNGTGKTTILKLLNQELAPDAGELRLGAHVTIGYYDQEHQVLHPEKTLFEELQDAYPTLDNTRIRNILAAFLFTNDDVYKQIKSLSGGERGRVSLAKLMLSEANFLILDEPTNHLDITSREILEDALNRYTGTVLYVSHDRYFINRTATRILDLTQGQLLNYIGNYDYYLEKRDTLETALGLAAPTVPSSSGQDIPSSGAGKLGWQQQKEEQARIRKLQNELKQVEEEITALEVRNEEINQLLTQEDIYTDVARLMELNQEKKELDERLEQLMERWEELSE